MKYELSEISFTRSKNLTPILSREKKHLDSFNVTINGHVDNDTLSAVLNPLASLHTLIIPCQIFKYLSEVQYAKFFEVNNELSKIYSLVALGLSEIRFSDLGDLDRDILFIDSIFVNDRVRCKDIGRTLIKEIKEQLNPLMILTTTSMGKLAHCNVTMRNLEQSITDEHNNSKNLAEWYKKLGFQSLSTEPEFNNFLYYNDPIL